jgi:molybdopterin synthase sulfur carrier subunit
MSVTIRIPTPLRTLTREQETVQAEGSTIAEVLDSLQQQYPGIKERICDTNGELRRFVNCYLNDEDIRFKDGAATAVNDGDEVSIIPAIAGG